MASTRGVPQQLSSNGHFERANLKMKLNPQPSKMTYIHFSWKTKIIPNNVVFLKVLHFSTTKFHRCFEINCCLHFQGQCAEDLE
jgi:hypothetical protein